MSVKPFGTEPKFDHADDLARWERFRVRGFMANVCYRRDSQLVGDMLRCAEHIQRVRAANSHLSE